MNIDLQECQHSGGGAWWETDGHGIPLCKVCDRCVDAKLKGFRPDIFTQYECDEPIEPEL